MRATTLVASVASAMCFMSATTAVPVFRPAADTASFAAPPPPSGAAERRLISFADNSQQWLTEEGVFELIRAGTNFIDVTDGDINFAVTPKSLVAPKALPGAPAQQTLVKSLIEQIDQNKMKTWLTSFSDFHTRYYKTATGKQAAEWIKAQAEVLATAAGAKGLTVTVKEFTHTWGQSSVIARIEPSTNGTFTTQASPDIVVLGSHLDSINGRDPYNGRSPGVDDDGSGSATIFETYRLLLENGVAPTRPIEFQWYAGEEAGLLGSQKIATKYKTDKVPILGMLQLDMTGYTPPNKKEILGIATDYVSKPLSQFVQRTAKEYVAIPWADVKCGYGCSDHASFTGSGFPAAFSFESSFGDSNPSIHTDKDTMEKISFPHMAEFVKLALGFAVELGLSK